MLQSLLTFEIADPSGAICNSTRKSPGRFVFFSDPSDAICNSTRKSPGSSFFVNRTEFDFGTTHPNDFQWFKKMCFNTLFDN